MAFSLRGGEVIILYKHMLYDLTQSHLFIEALQKASVDHPEDIIKYLITSNEMALSRRKANYTQPFKNLLFR